MLSVRVSDDEIDRIKKLSLDLIQKHKYLKEADVLRELIGLEDTGLITSQMRRTLLPENKSQPGDELEVIPGSNKSGGNYE